MFDDYYYDFEDDYYEYERYYDTSRYSERISQLKKMKDNFCGMDIKNIKKFLDDICKTDDVAKAYKHLLYAEEYNIQAKDCSSITCRESLYSKKENHIHIVADICKKHEDWCWGVQPSDVIGVRKIIYFEIPGCEQVSFHSKRRFKRYPVYEKCWDKKENSTLIKLEAAIDRRYSEQLKDRREAYRKEQELKEQKRIEFLLRRSSVECNDKNYNNIVKHLSNINNVFKYVRIKYREDGMFVSADNADKKFNLYIEGNSPELYNKKRKKKDGYDAFIEVYKIIDLKTGSLINSRYEEAVAIQEEKRRQEIKNNTVYVQSLKDISKTASKRLYFIVDEISENGELYYIKKTRDKNKVKVYFNPLKDENGIYVLVKKRAVKALKEQHHIAFRTYLSKTENKIID